MEQATPRTPLWFSVQQALALFAGVLVSIVLRSVSPHLIPYQSVFSHESDRPRGAGAFGWLAAYRHAWELTGHFPWNLLFVAVIIFMWVRLGFARKYPVVVAFLIGWCVGWLALSWLA